jgi:hypothetical protein
MHLSRFIKFFFFFFQSESCQVAEAGFKFTILLPLPPNCLYYKHMPPIQHGVYKVLMLRFQPKSLEVELFFRRSRYDSNGQPELRTTELNHSWSSQLSCQWQVLEHACDSIVDIETWGSFVKVLEKDMSLLRKFSISSVLFGHATWQYCYLEDTRTSRIRHGLQLSIQCLEFAKTLGFLWRWECNAFLLKPIWCLVVSYF